MEQEEEFTYCYGSLESRESDSRCGFALFFRDCLLSALCMYMYGLIFYTTAGFILEPTSSCCKRRITIEYVCV